MKEQGYDVMTDGLTFLVMAPKGLPPKTLDTLYTSFKKAQQDPNFQKFIKSRIIIANDQGTDYWNAELQKQYNYYSVFLKEIGLIK